MNKILEECRNAASALFAEYEKQISKLEKELEDAINVKMALQAENVKVEFKNQELEREIASLKAEAKHIAKKQDHGCTDMPCMTCDQ